MKKIFFLLIFLSLNLHAEVSNEIFEILVNKDVVVDKFDGSEVHGALTAIYDLAIFIT